MELTEEQLKSLVKAITAEVVKSLLPELEKQRSEGSPILRDQQERELSSDLERKLQMLAEYIVKNRDKLGF